MEFVRENHAASFRQKHLVFVLGACALYSLVSFLTLDKYPAFYADEAFYSEPSVHLLNEGRIFSSYYAYIPGFETSNIIFGWIFTFFQAVSFKFLGITMISIRLQSFLAGFLVLWLTFLISLELFSDNYLAAIAAAVLALSHVFIFAHHFGKTHMDVAFFVILTVFL